MTSQIWDDSVWANWSDDIRLRPCRHYHPTRLEELCDLVAQAEAQQPPKQVHAVGSSWSFSGPGATADFLVETRDLHRTLDTVIPGALLPQAKVDAGGWQADRIGLYHVEAGVILHELCLRLDGRRPNLPAPFPVATNGTPAARRWALPTMGGSSGQTLAGAISTGTHGMDVRLPPMADAVRALHLVGSGGRQHWIEKSSPVTSEDALRRAYPGLEIHYDDKLLAAVLVSLGRFGIVYSVLLDVVPQFSLRTVTRRRAWAEVRDELAHGALLDEHRSVQVVISPYATPSKGRGHTCYVTTRDEVPAGPPAGPELLGWLASCVVNGGGSMLRMLSAWLTATWLAMRWPRLGRRTRGTVRNLSWLAQSPALVLLPSAAGRPGDVLAFVARLSNRYGLWRVTAALVRGILAVALRDRTTEDVSYEAMATPPWADEYYRGHSVEVFFDATGHDYLQTITDHLIPLIEAHARRGQAIVGWFALRFTGQSSALLAMQQWDRTVSAEIAVLRHVPGSVQVLRELESEAITHGGLVHWGQQNDLDSDQVQRMFPALPEWRHQLRVIAGSETAAKTFENDYCRQRGLTL
jgi:FAD/FMN-containing dehydrogenase